MSDPTGGPATGELQFDRVSRPGAAAVPATPSASCVACHRQIDDVYYDINGHAVCASCRTGVEQHAQTPAGIGPLLMAGLFGFGGALVGAAVYYAVLAIGFEIGIIAILSGYLVGYMVKKGTGNRGGRRFQILAVLLTYVSIAMAYTPIAIKAAVEARQEKTAQAGLSNKVVQSGVSNSDATVILTPTREQTPETASTSGGGFLPAVVMLLGLLAALPLIAAFGSMPSGLISLAIMFFGMRQAWRMTAAPSLVVNGPYRVGGASPIA
jgi:hypothetical protein